MNLVEFSASPAFAGGLLIGLAAVMLMLTTGKIAGISGIFASLLKPARSMAWQWAFIAGLVCSGVLMQALRFPVSIEIQSDKLLLIAAGLLVGFGTRLGSGCTSGHGVCGISRISPRSLVATGVFIGTGVLTVFLMSLMGWGG